MIESQTKVYLLAAGTAIYTIGYLAYLLSVIQGTVTGLSAIAGVLMTTGILIAMVFGVALAKIVEETVG